LAVSGITDSMTQYWKANEAIYNNKPKYSKQYGVKRPDSKSIIAVLAGIFVVLVIIGTYV